MKGLFIFMVIVLTYTYIIEGEIMENAQIIQAKYETTECVICFDEFTNSNICITPCGHKFCFKCLMKHMDNSDTCPCCRELLKEKEEDVMSDGSSLPDLLEDSSDDEYDSDDEEIHYHGDEFTFDNLINIGRQRNSATPKQITEELVKLDYTMEDIMMLWTWRVDRMDIRYSQSFIKKLWDDLAEIIKRLDIENTKQCEESMLMEQEDKKDTILINLHEIFNDE